jgi:hypothetical protein
MDTTDPNFTKFLFHPGVKDIPEPVSGKVGAENKK